MGLRNKTRAIRVVCLGIAWLGVLLALGCAAGERRTAKAGSTTAKPPVEPPTLSVAEPATLSVDVQRNASGLTFTEHVPVTDQVRADYETAVDMLKQGQYDQGIPLMVKVTEQVPALTSALHTSTPETLTKPRPVYAKPWNPIHNIPPRTTNSVWCSGARESSPRRALVMRPRSHSLPISIMRTRISPFCATCISGITRVPWSITRRTAD